jgi:hypothetical protein
MAIGQLEWDEEEWEIEKTEFRDLFRGTKPVYLLYMLMPTLFSG